MAIASQKSILKVSLANAVRAKKKRDQCCRKLVSIRNKIESLEIKKSDLESNLIELNSECDRTLNDSKEIVSSLKESTERLKSIPRFIQEE